MSTHSVLAALPMAAIAGALLLVGSRIRAGDLHLIAGYDRDRVDDKAGLGGLFGRMVMALAVAALAAAIIQAVHPAWGYWAALGFGSMGVVAIIVLFTGRSRYDAPRADNTASGGKSVPLPPNDR